MTTRLGVRLDSARRSRLDEIAQSKGAPISEVVRSLIDDAYEDMRRERIRRAVDELCGMNAGDMPDPEELARQLESAHAPCGV